jgi:hypothetical protein
MKLLYSILLIGLSMVYCRAGDLISIDDFKKVKDPDKREELIQKAPPEQREALKKIHLHMYLLDYFGGEAGLKREKESYVAKARGFERLESLFDQQGNMWEEYIGAVDTANEKAGMTHDKMADAERELRIEEASIKSRLAAVHSLLFNLAASPAALELDKKAGDLDEKIEKRLVSDGTTPNSPITKSERLEYDKQLDQTFEELKKLPALPPEQVQKEYNEFPEEKIYAFGL